jgi:hypothetical protein
MRRLALIAVAALALVPVMACDDDPDTSPSTGPVVFDAQLRASSEVPPVSNAESNVTGTAVITFNVPRDNSGAVTGGGTANFQVAVTGFPGGSAYIAAHIHPGIAGVNGSPLVNLNLPGAPGTAINGGSATLNVEVPITQTQAQQIIDNPIGFYFNIHTVANGGGVARGQLVRR